MNLPRPLEIQTMYLRDGGTIPNHPHWPVLLYIGALRDNPKKVERIFNDHDWRNSWTNGVFSYHHYHSNTHEVLGVVSGSATLQLGGEQGDSVTLQAGDVVVLPAGTGHRKVSSSADFQIVGAYPKGIAYNTHTSDSADLPQVLEEIRSVPIPETDPLYGEKGPLLEYWGKV